MQHTEDATHRGSNAPKMQRMEDATLRKCNAQKMQCTEGATRILWNTSMSVGRHFVDLDLVLFHCAS